MGRRKEGRKEGREGEEREGRKKKEKIEIKMGVNNPRKLIKVNFST
jgi:hypothetical protein